MNSVFLLLGAILLFSGCVSSTRQFELLVSDQAAAIGDFDALIVHISEATLFSHGPTTIAMDSDVDLTQVVGENALPLLTASIPAGEYQHVSLAIDSIEGIVSGERVEVKLPSSQITLNIPFTVGDGTTSFVADISVVKTGEGTYILRPVASESGVIGKDLPEASVARGEISAEAKLEHANKVLERAREKLAKGNDDLEREDFDGAKSAFAAAEKGFGIAQEHYEKAEASGESASRAEASIGVSIAGASMAAAHNFGQAVTAYKNGDQNRVKELSDEAARAIASIPDVPVGGLSP